MALLARTSKPSPERKALAEAIEAHAQALTTRQRAAQTGAKLEDARYAAIRAMQRAEEVLEATPAAIRDYARRAAAGEDVQPPMAPAAARAALVEAQGAYEIADEAHRAFQSIPPRRDWTADNLERAAQAVMRAEAGTFAATVVADIERVGVDLMRKMSLLDFLDHAGALPHGEQSFGRAAWPADDRARVALERYNHIRSLMGDAGYSDESGLIASYDGSTEWRAAYDALLNDATTVLPVSA